MLKAIQKFLTIILLAVGLLFLGYQAFLYSLVREKLPTATMIAGIDVGGMSREEAANALRAHYWSPVTLQHLEEEVDINPQDVGFNLDVEAMLDQAEAARGEVPFAEGFVEFLLNRSFETTSVQVVAGHDQAALRTQLENVASFLDKPATAPQLMLGAGSNYQPGEAGYVTDVDASLPAVEMALYQADVEDRQVELVIEMQEPAELNMDVLRTQIEQVMANDGQGLLASVFIIDLETGEELAINADQSISGLSILKIAIFVEAYRRLDGPPNEYVQGILYDTAVQSSNYGANLLLHEIAGEANTYEGAELLTESLHRLGLVNTFMAIPYDAIAVSTRPNTYTTPANNGASLIFEPDTARQTTAEDIGTLLAMIYHCANGGGALLAVYPGELTPQECQAIIDLMILNEEGNLIRFGVPETTLVSHKHGWDEVTHGDAGIVFSPNRDYVIVEYLHFPQGDFLLHDFSFPILRQFAQLTYNYFNFQEPYTENVVDRALREAAAAAAAEAALDAEADAESPEGEEESAEEGETAVTPTATPATLTPTP
ncbi:serine hydrolase [Candidatus Leptofilum sp.]|uniref:serine hydrolase n=1 Tax=Candidatus Leptofilum sp. TaxID=3241576 RepID=UPI003B595100